MKQASIKHPPTMRDPVSKLNLILLLHLVAIATIEGAIMDLNNVKFIEHNDARLIATSNYNYAMMSPKMLSRNWRTVSVNGDKVLMITTTNEVISQSKGSLSEDDRQFVESLRDEIGSASGQGNYGYVSSMSGAAPGGSTMISSNTGRSSSSSSMSTSSSSAIQQSSGSSGTTSVSMRDDDNFSVTKSDLPYNWSTVFMNGALVTFVTRDGEVEMRTLASLEQDRLAAVNRLKEEMKAMQRAQEQQISNTMQNSLDMVSSVFSNIMGRFPRPPSYQSAVGNMFGDNFPFGTRNSPFNAGSGWPFGNGAFAFANGR